MYVLQSGCLTWQPDCFLENHQQSGNTGLQAATTVEAELLTAPVVRASPTAPPFGKI
jgi:hypothetical protein